MSPPHLCSPLFLLLLLAAETGLPSLQWLRRFAAPLRVLTLAETSNPVPCMIADV